MAQQVLSVSVFQICHLETETCEAGTAFNYKINKILKTHLSIQNI